MSAESFINVVIDNIDEPLQNAVVNKYNITAIICRGEDEVRVNFDKGNFLIITGSIEQLLEKM